jgi:hypothetical protein
MAVQASACSRRHIPTTQQQLADRHDGSNGSAAGQNSAAGSRSQSQFRPCHAVATESTDPQQDRRTSAVKCLDCRTSSHWTIRLHDGCCWPHRPEPRPSLPPRCSLLAAPATVDTARPPRQKPPPRRWPAGGALGSRAPTAVGPCGQRGAAGRKCCLGAPLLPRRWLPGPHRRLISAAAACLWLAAAMLSSAHCSTWWGQSLLRSTATHRWR